MNTADFHIGQDQNEGDNETKPLGVVSKSENFVQDTTKKKTVGNSIYWMVKFSTIWTDSLTRLTRNPLGAKNQQNNPIRTCDNQSEANQHGTGQHRTSSWKFQADQECREKGNSIVRVSSVELEVAVAAK